MNDGLNTEYVYSEMNHYYGEKMDFSQHAMRVRECFSMTHSHRGSIQGSTVFENYLFQFHDGNEACAIYDISGNTLLQTFDMPNPNPKYHCNAAAFGSEYYSPEDRFPLLYVSNEHIDIHNAIVYRVTGEDGSMKLEPVQTITFPAPTPENELYYPSIAIDRDKNVLICLTLNGNPYPNTTVLKYSIYDLPKLSDGDIEIDSGSAARVFLLPAMVATQGNYVFNSKLYQAAGAPPKADSFIKVLDLERGAFVSAVCLNRQTIIQYEPESCYVYNGKLYVTTVKGKVYEIEV